MKDDRVVTVYGKSGELLSPCTEKVAWVLISRRRAIRRQDNSIQIVLDKRDIKELKKKIIERDNRTCFYCGKIIDKNEIATVDHLNPKHITEFGDSGYDSEENLVCSCVECNQHKASTPYEEYIIYRLALIISCICVRLGIGVEIVLNKICFISLSY